jgi:azurin
MKIPLLTMALVATLLATGCGRKETATSGEPQTANVAATATTTPAAVPAPRVVEITGNDQMKFSVTTIEVKVGEQVKVVFRNIGQLPKEAMGHNWVLLRPGSDVNAFATTAMGARDKDYIPDSLKDQIIAHTAMLGPRQTDEVTFLITAAGEYPFLCSFPAHAMAGMKGVLIARE